MEKPERLVEGYVCLSGGYEGLTSVRESLLNTHGKEEEGTQWFAGVESQQRRARVSLPVNQSAIQSVSRSFSQCRFYTPNVFFSLSVYIQSQVPQWWLSRCVLLATNDNFVCKWNEKREHEENRSKTWILLVVLYDFCVPSLKTHTNTHEVHDIPGQKSMEGKCAANGHGQWIEFKFHTWWFSYVSNSLIVGDDCAGSLCTRLHVVSVVVKKRRRKEGAFSADSNVHP